MLDFRVLTVVFSVLSAQELDRNPVTMRKTACSAMRGLSIVSKQVHCWQVRTCILCMAAEIVVLFCKDWKSGDPGAAGSLTALLNAAWEKCNTLYTRSGKMES